MKGLQYSGVVGLFLEEGLSFNELDEIFIPMSDSGKTAQQICYRRH